MCRSYEEKCKSFLKVLLQMQRPVNILEVGTAVGFSTLLFCEYAPKEAKIHNN